LATSVRRQQEATRKKAPSSPIGGQNEHTMAAKVNCNKIATMATIFH